MSSFGVAMEEEACKHQQSQSIRRIIVAEGESLRGWRPCDSSVSCVWTQILYEVGIFCRQKGELVVAFTEQKVVVMIRDDVPSLQHLFLLTDIASPISWYRFVIVALPRVV